MSIHNGVADDYESLREPKFYDSKLPFTGCDIPMPSVKPIKDQMCEFCAKEDVCNIKEESTKAYKDILDIEGRTNVFINITVNCKKFLRKPSVNNVR